MPSSKMSDKHVYNTTSHSGKKNIFCASCRRLISKESYYNLNHEPHCMQCFQQQLQTCSKCGQKIKGTVVKASGNFYHPECFRCRDCDQQLDADSKFVSEPGTEAGERAGDEVVCITCHRSKFCPKCTSCDGQKRQIFDAKQGTFRNNYQEQHLGWITDLNSDGSIVQVVAMGKTFHVDCYTCEDCGMALSNHKGRVCYPLDGHLLCRQCNNVRLQLRSVSEGGISSRGGRNLSRSRDNPSEVRAKDDRRWSQRSNVYDDDDDDDKQTAMTKTADRGLKARHRSQSSDQLPDTGRRHRTKSRSKRDTLTRTTGSVINEKGSCFVCIECGVVLDGGQSHEVTGVYYCSKCHGKLVYCAACKRMIKGERLKAVGKLYHPNCFKCEVCKKALNGKKFTRDGDSVLCVECYQVKFYPRCAACKGIIKAANERGEILHISAMDMKFHVDCFKCQDCNVVFSTAQGRPCYPLDGLLLCKHCNNTRLLRNGDAFKTGYQENERNKENDIPSLQLKTKIPASNFDKSNEGTIPKKSSVVDPRENGRSPKKIESSQLSDKIATSQKPKINRILAMVAEKEFDIRRSTSSDQLHNLGGRYKSKDAGGGDRAEKSKTYPGISLRNARRSVSSDQLDNVGVDTEHLIPKFSNKFNTKIKNEKNSLEKERQRSSSSEGIQNIGRNNRSVLGQFETSFGDPRKYGTEERRLETPSMRDSRNVRRSMSSDQLQYVGKNSVKNKSEKYLAGIGQTLSQKLTNEKTSKNPSFSQNIQSVSSDNINKAGTEENSNNFNGRKPSDKKEKKKDIMNESENHLMSNVQAIYTQDSMENQKVQNEARNVIEQSEKLIANILRHPSKDQLGETEKKKLERKGVESYENGEKLMLNDQSVKYSTKSTPNLEKVENRLSKNKETAKRINIDDQNSPSIDEKEENNSEKNQSELSKYFRDTRKDFFSDPLFVKQLSAEKGTVKSTAKNTFPCKVPIAERKPKAPNAIQEEPSEPVVKSPEPVVKSPEPVVKSPEPVVKSPEPVVKSPEPVVKSPEPVIKSPEPVVKSPEPVIKPPVLHKTSVVGINETDRQFPATARHRYSSQSSQSERIIDLEPSTAESSETHGTCKKCEEPIHRGGIGYTAVGSDKYHVYCFVCQSCETILTGTVSYAGDEGPFCDLCNTTGYDECCVCKGAMTEKVLTALGKSYHPECFACVGCDRPLDGDEFTVGESNIILCTKCYETKYSPRCGVCDHLISSSPGGNNHAVCKGKSYHKECYRCSSCGAGFSSEPGHACCPVDGRLLCGHCVKTRGRRIR